VVGLVQWRLEHRRRHDHEPAAGRADHANATHDPHSTHDPHATHDPDATDHAIR
jgi:hypothetical protein